MNPDKNVIQARPVVRAKFIGQGSYFSLSPNFDLDFLKRFQVSVNRIHKTSAI
jgi:hypothetical protein